MKVTVTQPASRSHADLFIYLRRSTELMILVKTERQGIRYLCEELSDTWQWDLVYESRAWIEDESHWNEYDQMDVWS